MDNIFILSRIAFIVIFAISITVLVAVVIYLWRQRRESKSLRIRVDALGKLIGAHTQGVAEIGDMFARNSNGVASLDTLIRAVDDKLSEHIVALTVRANAARENIVTLTDGQNIQRSGLDVTVNAVTELVSKVTRLVAFATMIENQTVGTEQAVTQLQSIYTGLSNTVVRRVTDLNLQIKNEAVELARFEHALRGAADFREFVEMYVGSDGD